MRLLFFIIVLMITVENASAGNNGCYGKFVNPITDVCWSCMFPFTIGGVKVAGHNKIDTKNPSNPVCVCPKNGIPVPGVAVGFWEPALMVDITRTPYCMVNLGGISFATNYTKKGGPSTIDDQNRQSFYHIHIYKYPLLSWLNILKDFMCLQKGSFSVAYMSEFDPTWDDDAMAMLINPDVNLFANLTAQASCAVDCAKAQIGFPIDSLYWCAGCHGSVFPLTGNVSGHVGEITNSKLLATRGLSKLTRVGMLPRTSGMDLPVLCEPQPQFVLRKTQWKFQLVNPIAETGGVNGECKQIGREHLLDSFGKVIPIKGEDQGILIWGKSNCCAG